MSARAEVLGTLTIRGPGAWRRWLVIAVVLIGAIAASLVVANLVRSAPAVPKAPGRITTVSNDIGTGSPGGHRHVVHPTGVVPLVPQQVAPGAVTGCWRCQ